MVITNSLKEVVKNTSNNYKAKYKKLYNNINILAITPIKDNPLTVSIIVPAWNSAESILSCLASIEQNSFALKFPDKLEVIVVDDGSTDETWQLLKNNVFSFNMIAVQQKHKSLAHARNTGFSVSSGEVIISIDSDIVLNHFCIEQMVEKHMEMPDVVLVGFRGDIKMNDPLIQPESIRNAGGIFRIKPETDIRLKFPHQGKLSNMCLTSDHFSTFGNGKGLLMPGDEDPWLLSDMLFGALNSVRRSLYERVGGYDERFFGWGNEDGYFAAKVIASNQYIVPLYTAFGFHIFHKPRNIFQNAEYKNNRKLFFELLKNTKVGKYPNYLKNAKKRVVKSFKRKHRKHNKKTSKVKRNLTFSQETLLAIGRKK